MISDNTIDDTIKLINKYSDDAEALRLITLIAVLSWFDDSTFHKVEDALSKLDSKK